MSGNSEKRIEKEEKKGIIKVSMIKDMMYIRRLIERVRLVKVFRQGIDYSLWRKTEEMPFRLIRVKNLEELD